MCNVGKAFDRAITAPGSGANEAAQQQMRDAQAKAQAQQSEILQAQADTAAKALKLQQDAVAAAQAAAMPVLDNPGARAAAENRMRSLISASSFAVTAGQKFLGAPPVGFRMLQGA